MLIKLGSAEMFSK